MNRKGFTLLELMVILGIFAILATIAIPGFNAWIPNQKLRSTARDLFSDLNMAKLNSLKDANTLVVVKVDPNNEKYTIWLDTVLNWALDGTEEILLRTEGIDIISTTMPFNTFAFSSRGMTASDLDPPTSGDSYDVYMKNSKERYMGVRISRAGSISIIKSTDGGTTWISD
jgi:type IV fimbrial biogenesis protein FimT